MFFKFLYILCCSLLLSKDLFCSQAAPTHSALANLAFIGIIENNSINVYVQDSSERVKILHIGSHGIVIRNFLCQGNVHEFLWENGIEIGYTNKEKTPLPSIFFLQENQERVTIPIKYLPFNFRELLHLYCSIIINKKIYKKSIKNNVETELLALNGCKQLLEAYSKTKSVQPNHV